MPTYSEYDAWKPGTLAPGNYDLQTWLPKRTAKVSGVCAPDACTPASSEGDISHLALLTPQDDGSKVRLLRSHTPTEIEKGSRIEAVFGFEGHRKEELEALLSGYGTYADGWFDVNVCVAMRALVRQIYYGGEKGDCGHHLGDRKGADAERSSADVRRWKGVENFDRKSQRA